MPQTSDRNRSLILKQRPHGAPDAADFRAGRNGGAPAARRPGAAAHPVPVARPLYARPHERRAILRRRGRHRRRHGRRHRVARGGVAAPRFQAGRLGAGLQRLAGLRPVRRHRPDQAGADDAPAPRRARACSACRASPPTWACSTSASRSPAKRWWWPPPPARSARWSARSPSSKAAARSASPAAPTSAATSSMNWASTPASTTAAPDFAAQLAAACPEGIDVYFENVGGAVFDAVLPLLNTKARVPVCGLIAHYNATALPRRPGPPAGC